MKILNGKRSALVFQLDSGQTLRVPSGQFSDPFIGTVALVRAIISSGSPKQVGFVVSNSYELNVIKDIPVAQAYYYATEDEAKKAILEGKEFPAQDSSAPAVNPEVAKLKEELAIKNKDLEELKQEISKMTSISEDDFNHLKRQLADKESELNAMKSRNDQLSEQIEKEVEDKKQVMIQRDDYKARYEKTSTELLEANNKLKAAVEAKPEVQLNEDGQTLEEVTDLFKKLKEQVSIEVKKYDDQIGQLTAQIQESQVNSISTEEIDALKARNAELESKLIASVPSSVLEAKDAEIAQLKADGATIVDNYNKAKAAVQHIMEKFRIAYIDGQYIQQAN